MDCDEEDNSGAPPATCNDESRSAVNSIILDYYKKIGRKRDLEQYFSLSTAQSEIRDPESTFWTRMKTENESSDSGERSDKKSESSHELCRISIRCSVPDPCTSQEEDSKTKTESVSPPIIIEEVSQGSRQNSEDDAMKSDDNNSQKSFDVLLDTSINKPLSPSSSITSQRKLEWDSLADVGYGNESDRKTSASSLSTLERLALKQQYSNNDTQQDNIGLPTAHSTPLEENESKSKNKKGVGKKSTKIYKKDVDFLEVNVPHSSNTNPGQSINVNLTKHISFNVEKDGKVTVENLQKDVSISPEKVSVETGVSPNLRIDKEIQTSLVKTKDISVLSQIPEDVSAKSQKIPILISLNTLRKRTRRKKFRMARRKLKSKKKVTKENNTTQERSGEQLSEAESFEYMPGHIYNQNQMTASEGPSHVAGNKSSLESSGVLTTDSSKGSKHSFSRDLEKSIDLLKSALNYRSDDASLKKQLIKQVCQRLLNAEYRDDDSGTDFLSGLSFSSKKLGLGDRNHTTTSTSDANNSTEKCKRPKKSILRSDKFNSGAIASTSQSAPNLPIASKSEQLVSSNLAKTFTSSNTDSDLSSKEKTSSDNVFAKTSSEELYQKYLQALKREEAYKRHLKDKEMFLKQKLVSSDSAFKVPVSAEVKPNNRLKDLINDLTRNNYDDGSGDASKLEVGPRSHRDFDRFIPNRSQRSHSVFTLSSGNSDGHNKKPNLKKRLQCDIKDLSKPGPSKDSHYCCCPHHSGSAKIGVTDSSVQVNIKSPCTDDTCSVKQKIHNTPKHNQRPESPTNIAKIIHGDTASGIKYVCLCNNKATHDIPDNVLIYKYSRLPANIQPDETSKAASTQPCNAPRNSKGIQNLPSTSKSLNNENNGINTCSNVQPMKRMSKSSQTNLLIKMLQRKPSNQSLTSDDRNGWQDGSDKIEVEDSMPSKKQSTIYEATRCIQTEISINPRIAEPSLSDINIVSESECAKLISEHCRKPLKPSITNIYESLNNAETCTYSDSIKSSGTSKPDENELEEDFRTTDEFSRNITKHQRLTRNVDKSDKFAIPIQGTNMTLMVSIGSELQGSKNREETISEGVETNKVTIVEQATCLTEECSKGGQTEPLSDMDIIDHNSNEIGNTIQKSSKMTETMKDPGMVTTSLKSEEPQRKSNTYPKTSPCNEPLHHSHGIYSIDKACGVQTDLFTKRDAQTQEIFPIETQTSDHTLQKIKKCNCGCFNSEDCNKTCSYCKNIFQSNDEPNTCKEKYIDNKIDNSSKNLLEKRFSINDTEFKIDIPTSNEGETEFKIQPQPKATETCACRCGGTKDDCLENCNERNASPRDQSGKQSLVKKPCVRSDSPDKQSEKCSCGCEGTKDNCLKDCVERSNETRREEPRKQSLIKTTCGQDEYPDKQSDKCSCGCGNTIDNCKEDCSERKTSEDITQTLDKKEVGTQKSLPNNDKSSPNDSIEPEIKQKPTVRNASNSKDQPQFTESEEYFKVPKMDSRGKQTDNKITDKVKKTTTASDSEQTDTNSDPILNLIQDITKRFSKKDSEKSRRKKCFTEIMVALNYLLETDDCTEIKGKRCVTKSTPDDSDSNDKTTERSKCEKSSKKLVDKGVQLPNKRTKSRNCIIESSDIPTSTDIPGTSSDSATCKVLNKIKKECDKYHQKRCKAHTGIKCDASSSTSINCDQCRRVHHCSCRSHKCKVHKKSAEKISKGPVAYNLILQTSESMISDLAGCDKKIRQLKNIIVKVPKKKPTENIPFNEMAMKFERNMACASPRILKPCRSRSLPNESEISGMDEIMRRSQGCTVRDYLEKNRPDFVERCSQRQGCLKYINECRNEKRCACPNLKMVVVHTPNCMKSSNVCFKGVPMTRRTNQCYKSGVISLQTEVTGIANQRAVQRDLLSMHVAQLPDVTSLDSEELRCLAKDLGRHMRRKQPAPQFISEREMKKHSEKIYKSLPEVAQKREEIKKENIKKTNLLMANIFKKSLQKKTLRGSVNLSNYSTVIKI